MIFVSPTHKVKCSSPVTKDRGSENKMSLSSHISHRLDGNVALVRGFGRGIGTAIAIELGRLGAKVVVNYANSVESAGKVVAGVKELGSVIVSNLCYRPFNSSLKPGYPRLLGSAG